MTNGGTSTADMAHPTRTGDAVIFASPPYQFDAATPGTLFALSAFFGQHGYVPDTQDLKSNTNMRATFLAGGRAIERGKIKDVRSIDLAPTAAFLLGIPEPQHSQGRVLLDVVKGGSAYKPISIIGLNDFHGQLDPTTRAYDFGRNANVGGAAQLATMFGMSRTIVREALARLASDGITEARRGAGSYVKRRPSERLGTHMPLDSLAGTLGTYEVRFVLEAEAARLAAPRPVGAARPWLRSSSAASASTTRRAIRRP